MTKGNFSTHVLVALACAGFISLATRVEASPIYNLTASAGLVTSTPGAITFATFDSPTLAFATITGGSINGGSNPGAGGNWIGCQLSTPCDITFTGGLRNYFGLYWGTNDGTSNPVAFYNGATLLGTVLGVGGPNSFFNISANADGAFNRVVLLYTGGCCFEVDNLAVQDLGGAAPVPEPATLVLLATGLAAVAVRRFPKRA